MAALSLGVLAVEQHELPPVEAAADLLKTAGPDEVNWISAAMIAMKGGWKSRRRRRASPAAGTRRKARLKCQQGVTLRCSRATVLLTCGGRNPPSHRCGRPPRRKAERLLRAPPGFGCVDSKDDLVDDMRMVPWLLSASKTSSCHRVQPSWYRWAVAKSRSPSCSPLDSALAGRRGTEGQLSILCQK